MNGVLEEKKEKSLEKELVEEEWMRKPREEMSEEEMQKYDSFLERNERIRQDQDKLKKVLQQELKKLFSDIKKVYEEFDNHLDYLFMKRLEFQYRVYEQELVLIKVQQTVWEEEATRSNMALVGKMRQEQGHHCSQKRLLKEQVEELVRAMEHEKEVLESEVAKTETKNLKQIMQSTLNQKDEHSLKKSEVLDEKMERYIADKSLLAIPVSHPLHKVEKDFLMKKLENNPVVYQETVLEFLQRKYESEAEVQSEWNRFVKLFMLKVALKTKVKEMARTKKSVSKFEDGIRIQEEEIQSLDNRHQELNNRLKRLQPMCFLVFRTASMNIELPANKAVFFKSDTILIDRKEVTRLNNHIIQLGNQKVGLLAKNIEEKSKVEGELEDLRTLELEVKLSIIETFVLTRLKVSKKLQTLISKKDDKLMETEEKNLKKQTEKLVSSTDKIVSMYKRKEMAMKKELGFLARENEELLHHGGKLQESVTQRQEIFDMMFGKKSDELADENNKNTNADGKFDQKTYTKTMDLIKNRKLYDTAKVLAQEIENLMKELRNLQRRTFPNLG